MGNGLYTKGYSYRDRSDTQTTTQITQVQYTGLPETLTYGYTYDALGNIATYLAPGEGTVTYTYDALGQLIRAVGDETYTYTYDSVGNILTANGHTYTYGTAGWLDRLAAFDGEPITYDAVGNPLSYYNGTRWTFTWENGRSLATATDGDTGISYAYDADGLRTAKTVDGATTYYYYADGKLLKEICGSSTLDFFYDENGYPYAMKDSSGVYYYITNLQGDVMRMVDAQGNTVASYEYDPYGNILSATGSKAATNPLRYRGYYYDEELGMYYLQSRYYDPAIGRFINADVYASTGQDVLGYDMYAYCGNNPVSRADYSGCSWVFPLIPTPQIGKPKVITPVKYIKNQHVEGIGNLRLGRSTISHGGCGVIATYNALLMLKSKKNFISVLSYYTEKKSRLVLGGYGGIMPTTVAQYFRDNGYRVKFTDDPDSIDAYSKTADACILWYSWPNKSWGVSSLAPFYAHFVAYSKYGDQYVGYNTGTPNGVSIFRWPSDFGYLNSRNYAIGIFIYK